MRSGSLKLGREVLRLGGDNDTIHDSTLEHFSLFDCGWCVFGRNHMECAAAYDPFPPALASAIDRLSFITRRILPLQSSEDLHVHRIGP